MGVTGDSGINSLESLTVPRDACGGWSVFHNRMSQNTVEDNHGGSVEPKRAN